MKDTITTIKVPSVLDKVSGFDYSVFNRSAIIYKDSSA